MFSIKLHPPTRIGLDGQRLGQITIGDFSESFLCSTTDVGVEGLERRWRVELEKLCEGDQQAVLIHDTRFAWIVCREGEACYVQQVLSLDGGFHEHNRRGTITEDGDHVSEWETSVTAIRNFLASP